MVLIGLPRTMATLHGDNCWENGLFHHAAFRIQVASCDLRSLHDGKMEADFASTASFVVPPISSHHEGGAYFFSLSEQGDEKKESGFNDPEL